MNAEFTLPTLPAGLPAGAVVNLDAIRHNVETLRQRVGPATVMAVVKADAYGHGLVPSARAALAGGAGWLGVAQLAEALALRAAGVEAPVLAWLTVPGDSYRAAVAARIDIGVSTLQTLVEVAAAAHETGIAARVHLKIDTGLHRNGAGAAQWPDLVDAALKFQAGGGLDVVGVFSHYACAESPSHPSVPAQTAAFVEAIDLAERRGARFEVRHMANSAATLTNPASHFDLVRLGITVYGLSPVPALASAEKLGLYPAMTLLGRVANVKPVAAGQGVSYGHTYTTSSPTMTALVGLGYADGLPRQASNTGPVQLNGRRLRVSGRIAMDQFVVDLQDATGYVEAGDVAVLFGGAAGEPTAQDWADAADTISYEIVARIGSRVPRLYSGTAGTPSAAAEVGPGDGQDA